jgi:hypothetical protein
VQVERESKPDGAAADDRDLHRSSPRTSAAIVGYGGKEDKDRGCGAGPQQRDPNPR